MLTAAGLSIRVAWMPTEDAKRVKERVETRIKELKRKLEELGDDPPVAAWGMMANLNSELDRVREQLRVLEEDLASR